MRLLIAVRFGEGGDDDLGRPGAVELAEPLGHAVEPLAAVGRQHGAARLEQVAGRDDLAFRSAPGW